MQALSTNTRAAMVTRAIIVLDRGETLQVKVAGRTVLLEHLAREEDEVPTIELGSLECSLEGDEPGRYRVVPL